MKQTIVLFVFGIIATAVGITAVHAQSNSQCYSVSDDQGKTYHQACSPSSLMIPAVTTTPLVSNVNGTSVYRIADTAYSAVCYIVPVSTKIGGTPAISCISTR